MKGIADWNVAVFGVGAAGRALSCALLGDAGVRSLRIWARRDEAAEEFCSELSERTGGEAELAIRAYASSDLAGAVTGVDVVFLCVVDDALAELASEIALAKPEVVPGAVALHLSGYAGTRIMSSLAEIGFATGGMHPLISLAGATVERPRSVFRETHFALGGDRLARERARELVTALGGIPLELAPHESARSLYHGAASLLTGGAVAIFDAAERMLDGAVEADAVTRRAALMGLLQSTVRNLETGAASDILTGPIRRGDQATVAGHLDALRALAKNGEAGGSASQTEELYRQCSLAMLELVRRRGDLNSEDLDRIADLLSGRSNNT